jgi:uncharacterized phage-like protein YoqJ
LGGYDENNPRARYVKGALAKQIKQLVEQGYQEFISGGALGIDTWAAEIVLEFKKAQPHIRLIIAKPFPSQDKIWPEASKVRFKQMCEASDEVINVSPDPYDPKKMMDRNKWMVDRADVVVAVWDGSPGGTGNCVTYAKKKSKNIILIDPNGDANV